MTNELSVIFDVGHVLIQWDVRTLFRKMLPNEAAIDALLDETKLLEVNQRLDAGLSFADGIGELVTRFPQYAEPLQAFDTRWLETIPGPIEGMSEIQQSLKRNGVPIYAITNFSGEKWPLAQGKFPFLKDFKDAVVSGDEKLIKPDERIYRICLERNNLDPSRCIFVDDLQRNIDAANALGIDGVLFTGAEDFRKALIARGLPV